MIVPEGDTDNPMSVSIMGNDREVIFGWGRQLR
jgi:hypothetical protein